MAACYLTSKGGPGQHSSSGSAWLLLLTEKDHHHKDSQYVRSCAGWQRTEDSWVHTAPQQHYVLAMDDDMDLLFAEQRRKENEEGPGRHLLAQWTWLLHPLTHYPTSSTLLLPHHCTCSFSCFTTTKHIFNPHPQVSIHMLIHPGAPAPGFATCYSTIFNLHVVSCLIVIMNAAPITIFIFIISKLDGHNPFFSVELGGWHPLFVELDGCGTHFLSGQHHSLSVLCGIRWKTLMLRGQIGWLEPILSVIGRSETFILSIIGCLVVISHHPSFTV